MEQNSIHNPPPPSPPPFAQPHGGGHCLLSCAWPRSADLASPIVWLSTAIPWCIAAQS